jgi:uncharacterized protein
MSEIIEKIKNFVEEECKKPTSKYGYEPFESHFISVVDYAKKLAHNKNIDLELIELAGWLHDIGSIIFGRENHHLTGSEIAETKLKELNYPSEKIEIIKKCILNHRGPIGNPINSIEEQIIIEADSLSAFDNISGIFKAALVYENKSQLEAKHSVLDKLNRKWNQLSDEGKNLVKEKHKAAIILLGESK